MGHCSASIFLIFEHFRIQKSLLVNNRLFIFAVIRVFGPINWRVSRNLVNMSHSSLLTFLDFCYTSRRVTFFVIRNQSTVKFYWILTVRMSSGLQFTLTNLHNLERENTQSDVTVNSVRSISEPEM